MQKLPPTCNDSNHDHTPLPITQITTPQTYCQSQTSLQAHVQCLSARCSASQQPPALLPCATQNRAMRLTQQRRHLKTAQALKCSGPGTSSCLKSQPAPFWQPLSFRGFCSTKSQSQNKHEHRLQHRQPRLSPPMTACAAGAATLATSVTSGQVAWRA